MTDPLLLTPSGLRRGRSLGIQFDGEPGPLNSITDVPGVGIGYCTIVKGDGPLEVGVGPVRTGVTAILPRVLEETGLPVFAALHSLNGNGELTGSHWIQEVDHLLIVPCGGVSFYCAYL